MLPFMNVPVAKSMDSSFRWKDGGWARGHCPLKPARGDDVYAITPLRFTLEKPIVRTF